MIMFENFSDMPLAAANGPANILLQKVAAGLFRRNILLVGDVGSGKSTLARHLPYWFYKSLGHPQTYLQWYDCSIEFDIRAIAGYASNKVLTPIDFEWVVLDEVDKVYPLHKLNQLHGTLQRDTDMRFILTANKLSLLPEGVQSRCMTLNITAPQPQEYLPYAKKVLAEHGRFYTDEKLLENLTEAVQHGLDCRKYEELIEFAK